MAEVSQPDRDHPPTKERVNILLVDDHPANLVALRAILDDLGQNLVEVHSGEEALRRLEDEDFAVVLLDVQMHGLDGFETARLIRRLEKCRHTPIIFLTAYEDNRLPVEEAYCLGAVDYLVKPIVPVILRAKVSGFVELFQKTEQVKKQAEQLRQFERREFQQRLAEENARLGESAQFHRAIAELAYDFAYSGHFDLNGVLIVDSVTEAFPSVTGYTLDELNAQGGFATAIYPDDLPLVAQAIQRLLKGQDAKDEVRFITKGGQLRWMYFLAHPVWDESHSRVVRVYGAIHDITERKQAEEQLRFQSRVLDSVGQAVIVTDLQSKIIYWNHFAETLYGWRREEVLGCDVEAVTVAPAAVGRAAEIMERLKKGESWSGEFMVQRKDGVSFPALVSCAPVNDLQGKLQAIIGVSTDISDRKRLEEQLRERVAAVSRSEGRIRSVVNNVIDGIITIDERGMIKSLNPAAERIFGYSGAELVGRNVKMLMPEPYHSEHDEYIASYPRTGNAQIIGTGREVMGRRKDGSTFAMDFAISQFRMGGQRLFTGIVRDITERKRTEQSLRFLSDASAVLAGLVDYQSTLQKLAALAVPQFADWCAVDMVQPDGSVSRLAVAHVNPAKVQLAHEFHRRYPPEPDSMHAVPQVLRSGEPDMMTDIPEELIVRGAKDKEHLRMLRELGLKSYMCVPLKGRDRVLGVVSFVAAESGRRYTQDDLAFAQELARRAAIAIENAQLYAELREADRLKDEFLAMLAHELRNPLAPIRNALHVMKQSAAHEALVSQVRDMAERQVQHMARLLDDLLDVSRISRGRIELRKEVLDVGAIVNRSVEAVRPLFEERAHQLAISLPPEPIHVLADPTRLEQVLTNLLNNAAKYTDCRGQICISAVRERGDVVLRVSDTGVGIAADMLPRIFDLFVQAERRLDRSQGGVGIGLSLVKKLVELHGGRVEARSAGLWQGSEFIVRLAAVLDAADIATEPPARQGTVSVTTSRKVLVVDDNVDAADSLAMLLKLGGQDVRVAYDGPTALLVAKAFHPQIVLLDIGMPGMDGYEVARRLREQNDLTLMLLVALTGWGQDADKQRAGEAGFDRHLVKPVEPSMLEDLVANTQSIVRTSPV